jgi:uncharacterized protein (TIGR02453 family)
MAWFKEDYELFFKDLEQHNNREWFTTNKKRYERFVKHPFDAFVTDMILRMQTIDASCRLEAKDAVFRIYRDIRFSKDKTPYKTRMSAVIGQGGRKAPSMEGMYIEIGHQHLRLYGGIYQPDSDQLMRIRQEILYNLETFESLLNEPDFQAAFGTIHGERNKRLNAPFNEVVDRQPLIANKQFYYYTDLNPALITSDELVDALFVAYEKSAPMRRFLHAPLRD